MRKYFRVWKQLSACAIGTYMSSPGDFGAYFLGKLVRFGFFLLLIDAIFHHATTLAGYDRYEILLFFLVFSLADALPQAFFRGIYLFRDDIHKGNFDFILTRPLSPLFYSMSRLVDVLDMMFLLPIVALLFWVSTHLSFTLSDLGKFFFLFLTGQILVVAIHIFSACLTIWTLESANFMWFYRESMGLARFPADLFPAVIRIIFTYGLPIFIIVYFPARALLGTLTLKTAFFTLIFTAVFWGLSLGAWNMSIKKYQSASS